LHVLWHEQPTSKATPLCTLDGPKLAIFVLSFLTSLAVPKFTNIHSPRHSLADCIYAENPSETSFCPFLRKLSLWPP